MANITTVVLGFGSIAILSIWRMVPAIQSTNTTPALFSSNGPAKKHLLDGTIVLPP
jgi:hypothetical protein